MMYIMKELETNVTFTLEIKKSKFIAHLVPYSQFKIQQANLKATHPKARHIVYAYRFLNNFDQIVENLSDDGEPKGSAAPPALAVLRGNEIINCAVLIVRYFGGTKLGVGGLVRAYGQSVNAAINNATFQTYQKSYEQIFNIPFSHLAKFEHIISQLATKQISIEKNFSSTSCIFTIKTSREILNQLELFEVPLC